MYEGKEHRKAISRVVETPTKRICSYTQVSQKKSLQNLNMKSQRILQKMAWTATRPLGQIPLVGPLPQNQNNIVFNPMHAKTENHNMGNLSFNHRHIIFDRPQNLPIGNYDNIGFHCANGSVYGAGALFSEPWQRMGYRIRRQISHNNGEDQRLHQAINNNANPGNYNLLFNNCQDWVDRVTTAAGL
ncbi:hypothetical protein [Bacteroides timonensis]|uniref:hypothetical protein n=1 Tax=Bacteroides timonensis TaxID=1470345 RepID=UPI0005C4AD1F|nr:hypothetical protein [Bacteroides timonensis]